MTANAATAKLPFWATIVDAHRVRLANICRFLLSGRIDQARRLRLGGER